MNSMLELEVAVSSMIDEINDIYLICRDLLYENDIFQWDDYYPNRDYFQQSIESKELYVLKKGNEIVGHAVLNKVESEEWKSIDWEGGNPLIIHALMISPNYQGQGIGKDFIRLCEEKAAEKGYDSIRLDAFKGNEAAVRLYKKLGYVERGMVRFSTKPVGHQEYLCFEKVF